jgi:hypothetical protein
MVSFRSSASSFNTAFRFLEAEFPIADTDLDADRTTAASVSAEGGSQGAILFAFNKSNHDPYCP